MNKPKKLLVIAGGTYIYGAEKVTLDVIEGLCKQGYEVNAIISGWNDGQFAAALDNLQVRYHKLKLGWYYTSKILWSLDSLVHYPSALWHFLRIRKNYKNWLVYVISFRNVVLLWPFLKKNIIYHVHDPNYNSKRSRFFLKSIDRKVVKYIAVSNFIKKDLIKCGIEPFKIEVIHNGVDIQDDISISEPERNQLTIGIIGQVISRKGHEDVIEAFRILGGKGINNVFLKIVGKGDLEFEQKLKKLISKYSLDEKIRWEGFKQSKAEIYAGIDVVIVPTRNDEPFALVPLEANALGKMVIVTNTGGFPEMVIDGYNGFIIESGRPERIAEKIEQILANDEMRLEMGKNGISMVTKNFTKKTMINKVTELIENL